MAPGRVVAEAPRGGPGRGLIPTGQQNRPGLFLWGSGRPKCSVSGSDLKSPGRTGGFRLLYPEPRNSGFDLADSTWLSFDLAFVYFLSN